MVSTKKSQALKMLQLMLTLSLLHMDPGDYFQNHMRGWDDHFELRDGDGWVLEMLHTTPTAEYPYANRKTMVPLIDDLVQFDRQFNHYDIQAYLIDVQSDNANQTQALQELQVLPNGSQTSSTSTGSSATSMVVEPTGATSNNTNTTRLHSDSFSELEFFLNGENLLDQRSVWEQNLADLNDYSDFSLTNPYFGLPLKGEPSFEGNAFDVDLNAFLPDLASVASNTLELEGAVAPNDTSPNPQDGVSIKVERVDSESEKSKRNLTEDLSDIASCSPNCVIFKDEESELSDSTSMPQVDLSPFISQVELTKEESEIVEVLWKQDVDLGYSLNSAVIGSQANNSAADNSVDANTGKSDASEYGNACDDDIEKLKALEELKSDKPDFDGKHDNGNPHDDINDEWAGIPFTVDNETGEYIRLPLDELLNDVLQLAELAGETSVFDDESDSIASTSKAAAAAASSSLKNKKDAKVGVEQTETGGNTDNNQDIDLSVNIEDLPNSEIEGESPLPSPLFELDDEAKKELADFDIMIQSAAPPYHHHHHHAHPHHHAHSHRPTSAGTVAGVQNYAVGSGANSAFHRQGTGFHHGHHQGRMPLSRGVSMEQRLQDIASLFNPIPSMGIVGGVSEMSPYPHYAPHHYSYQGATGIAAPPQHSQYPPPPPSSHPHHHGHHAMLHANSTLGEICPTQPHYGHNLGSAVSSSMHLTNTTSHETDVTPGVGGAASAASAGTNNVGVYKMEHDMMYYSNASSDMNHTADGFINSIFNDEDLHLMDMNVNESFCRMVDVNSTSNNSSILGLSANHGTTIGSTSSANGVAMSEASAPSTNRGGMTTDLMNPVAQGGDRLDASSDSAVSSMGSERVPSLSDGEWGEGSDSAQDYHQGKYGGPYDYSYNPNSTRLNDGSRQPPVAQKKHQMFGKRILNEQPNINANGVVPTASNNQLLPAHPIKYEYEPYPTGATASVAATGHQNNANVLGEGAVGPILSKEHHAYDLKYGAGAVGGYSLDFSLRPPRNSNELIQHNHTYTLPQGTGSLPRPQQRDKKLSTSSSTKSVRSNSTGGEEEHLTRDEKRARALNIPIAVNDIINLPMDEFNERLSKYDLTENQLSLIRDIRRRGKNKVAAQNCRKRKLDQILSLEDEVKEVRKRKEQLYNDRDTLVNERKRISNKFAALHRHIFQYLRDPEGNPCSPSEYSLQQAADGSIYLLPRDSNSKADIASAILGSGSSTNSGLDSVNGGNHLNHSMGSHQHMPVAPPPPQQQVQQVPQQQQQQSQQPLTIGQTLSRHGAHPQPTQMPHVPQHHQGQQKD